VSRYFEPFAGSACLFLALNPAKAVLGDINSHLIGAYRTVRARPRAVLEQVDARLRETERLNNACRGEISKPLPMK
jgi:site-specific DNA-adenine methylase